MSTNQTNIYSIDRRIAEIYDRVETDLDDLVLIRELIGSRIKQKILEPFCGTGRLLIPLALDGHTLCGIDQSQVMLELARDKLMQLPLPVQHKVRLILSDAVSVKWPASFNIVILGGNCFYELALPFEQRQCVQSAAQVLEPGGFIFIDNDHMEGDLDPSWQVMEKVRSPLSGVCEDVTRIENFMQPVWFDVTNRLIKYKRVVRNIAPDGTITENEYIQQKHPVSTEEVQRWLIESGFTVLKHMGNYSGDPYTTESRRSIFWAQSDRNS